MEEIKSIESGVSVSAHGQRQFAEANCFHPALFLLEIWLFLENQAFGKYLDCIGK